MANLQRECERGSERLAELSERVASDPPLYGDDTIPFQTFDVGLGGTVVGLRREAGRDAEERVYVEFEDYFRGTEETIRRRQHSYFPLLVGRGPVLDVGCGRGELLEMLSENGIEARGIDPDSGMIEHCRHKGLHVEQADAASFLQQQPNGSLDVVIALQVVEHLRYAELLQFLRSACRVLRPGGRLILETVNPHSPQALKHFWIDPTHEHPLFPEILVTLCALTGFATAYIWYPQGSGDPHRDRRRQADYAVVAEVAAPRA